MRAIAVGMASTDELPNCPRDCGGPLGGQFPGALTESQASIRQENGCDSAMALARYTITCPECDGSKVTADGERCGYCEDSWALRGERKICRCPSSHMTAEISDAIRHYGHAEGGAFPVPGGLLDQSPSYIQFVGVLGSEVAKVQREAMEEKQAEAKNKANARRT